MSEAVHPRLAGNRRNQHVPWLLGLSSFVGPSVLLPKKGNWLSTGHLLLPALFFAEEGCSAPLNLEGVPRGLQMRPASLTWA